MQKKKYPYQNLSLENIKGERWKDIPGFEDEYQLSNFGRLKSQDRWVDYGHCDVFRPGRIKKLHVTSSARNKGRPEIQMQLHKDGKRYRFSVARYVFHLFVKPFDTEDHSFIVTRKDGDLLNIQSKNLVLRSISEVAIEGFATNRRKSRFQLQVKPVTQYDAGGKKIATYPDAKHASAATGVSPGYISGAALSGKRMAGGYYWRYSESGEKINVLKLSKPIDLPSEVKKDFPNHHYLNRGIKNIRNEKWKAIDGFEGFYDISDHGRVKSLRFLKQLITKNGNNTQFWTSELIMKQGFRKAHNHYINKPSHYLTVVLNNGEVISTCLVSRLVYQAFGKDKQAIGTKSIIHKDGDNLNNHISNLIPATRTEIIKSSFSNDRRKSHFAGLSKKERQKYARLAAKANYKPVIQYSLQGKKIAEFESMVAAAKAVGIKSSTLSNAASGRLRTAGGFIWRKG
jgi:NUMOD4 motif-containing protein/NUMOD1 domain-containing protein